MDSMLLAVVAFGLLLAIAVFGLISSNAASARRTGSYGTTVRREDGTRIVDARR